MPSIPTVALVIVVGTLTFIQPLRVQAQRSVPIAVSVPFLAHAESPREIAWPLFIALDVEQREPPSFKRHVLAGGAVGTILGGIAGIIAFQNSKGCCYEGDDIRWAVPVYTIVVGTTGGAAGGALLYGLKRLAGGDRVDRDGSPGTQRVRRSFPAPAICQPLREQISVSGSAARQAWCEPLPPLPAPPAPAHRAGVAFPRTRLGLARR